MNKSFNKLVLNYDDLTTIINVVVIYIAGVDFLLSIVSLLNKDYRDTH